MRARGEGIQLTSNHVVTADYHGYSH